MSRLKKDKVGGGGRVVRETPITVHGEIGHDFTCRVQSSSAPRRTTPAAEPRPGGRVASRESKILLADGTSEQARQTFLLAIAAQDEAARRSGLAP